MRLVKFFDEFQKREMKNFKKENEELKKEYKELKKRQRITN